MISDSEGIFWFFAVCIALQSKCFSFTNLYKQYGKIWKVIPLLRKGLNFLYRYFSFLHNLCEVGICDVANWLKEEWKLTKNLDVSFSCLRQRGSVFHVFPLKPPSYFAATPLGSEQQEHVITPKETAAFSYYALDRHTSQVDT